MDTPVLYLPYFTFPIDDRRKSGLLTPNFSASDRYGIESVTPYYWNIAPNYDATITPRYMSKKGLQLIT
ncbi:putative LPS assembly protein LptD, partial [Streptomyces scabiei]